MYLRYIRFRCIEITSHIFLLKDKDTQKIRLEQSFLRKSTFTLAKWSRAI